MIEKQNSKPQVVFTPEERKRLTSIKRKEKLRRKEFGQEVSAEKEFGSVPLITERTCNVLRYSLNMDNPRRLDSQADAPFYRASNITDGYLFNFHSDEQGTGTRSLYDNLKSWFKRSFVSVDEDDFMGNQATAIIGVGLVLKAFELQYGKGFIDNLKKTDSGEMLRAIDGQRIEELTDQLDVFEKIENDQAGIPQDQLFLGKLIEDFADLHSGDYGQQLALGANLMFGVIEKLWPKLKPGNLKNL